MIPLSTHDYHYMTLTIVDITRQTINVVLDIRIVLEEQYHH